MLILRDHITWLSVKTVYLKTCYILVSKKNWSKYIDLFIRVTQDNWPKVCFISFVSDTKKNKCYCFVSILKQIAFNNFTFRTNDKVWVWIYEHIFE